MFTKTYPKMSDVEQLEQLKSEYEKYRSLFTSYEIRAALESIKILEEKIANSKQIVIHDAADALNYVRPVLVIFEDDCIVFGGEKYEIEMSRIKTRVALIEWIHHMLSKNWMTNEILEQFIEKVCEYHKWKIYNDA